MTCGNTLSVVKDISDIVSNGVTVLGLITGAVWTFYHFFKGRVFKPRLTLQGTARRVRTPSGDYVVCGMTVANVGLAGDGDQLSRIGGHRILKSHEWVEPGAVLSEQTVISCPPEVPVVLADFRLVVRMKRRLGRRSPGVAFSTNAVGVGSSEMYTTHREEQSVR
jgi:hypothetical protein